MYTYVHQSRKSFLQLTEIDNYQSLLLHEHLNMTHENSSTKNPTTTDHVFFL